FPNTPIEGAELIADALRQHVQDLQLKHDYATDAGCVTISIGVACMLPNAENNAEALLKEADGGLYLAKEEGRNRIYSKKLS
ncbi:MAG: diguanylate cyclase, partial [Mariprofundaceae bacterium]|nr:diguanylate cyclase [Mariprofundaceae bacterium]